MDRIEQAAKAYDWYEVGEILKDCIFSNEYKVDLDALRSHYYLIDPEVLATYFLCQNLPNDKRKQLETVISPALNRSPVSADIIKASALYQQQLAGKDVTEPLYNLAKQTTSSTARFSVIVTLLRDFIAKNDAKKTYDTVREAAAHVAERQFFAKWLQPHVDAAFAATASLPDSELFFFYDLQKLMSPQTADCFKKITDKECMDDSKAFEIKCGSFTASKSVIAHHARAHALYLYLLATPLHERAAIEYDSVKSLLKLYSDIALEQLFAQLILQEIIGARMDSVNRTISLETIRPVSGNDDIRRVLVDRLHEWMSRVADCRALIGEAIERDD